MPDASSTPAQSRAKIVMGVDDTPENLSLVKFAVEASGYSFIGAPDGAQCLQLLTRFTPRLVLLDVEMPALDGYEICRRIRRIREMETVPIAFLTARKTAEDVRAGMAAGGNDFITKPFAMSKLKERIDHWVSRRLNRMPA
jgi:two-component system, OmpR family, response regulator